MFSSNSGSIPQKVDSTQMRSFDYLNQLDLTIQILNGIDKNSSEKEKIGVINNFMQKTGELFLDFEENNIKDGHINLDKKNSEIIKSHFSDIWDFYLDHLESVLNRSFDGDELFGVCMSRTNIESFNAMFGHIVEKLDTEDIDELIQQQKQKHVLFGETPPKNIPAEHWWWFE